MARYRLHSSSILSSFPLSFSISVCLFNTTDLHFAISPSLLSFSIPPPRYSVLCVTVLLKALYQSQLKISPHVEHCISIIWKANSLKDLVPYWPQVSHDTASETISEVYWDKTSSTYMPRSCHPMLNLTLGPHRITFRRDEKWLTDVLQLNPPLI